MKFIYFSISINSVKKNFNFLFLLFFIYECHKCLRFENNFIKFPLEKRKQDLTRSYSNDFTTLKRDLKFHISKISECNVFINDTVTFRREYNTNFIEHWILHNNVEDIEVKQVLSDDIKIKFFSYNKKINSFTVYFEEEGNSDGKNDSNKKEFSINFQYEAINLIKSNIAPNDGNDNFNRDAFFLDEKYLHPNNYAAADLNENRDDFVKEYDYSYNSILWKIFNKNYQTTKIERLNLELSFDLGLDFQKYVIYSKNSFFNFKKLIEIKKELVGRIRAEEDDPENKIVKFVWVGPIDSEDVLVLDIEFPLYFENCKYSFMSIFMVFVGSLFIVFIIFMFYIVFSSVVFNDF